MLAASGRSSLTDGITRGKQQPHRIDAHIKPDKWMERL
jgi:hypothetical protein